MQPGDDDPGWALREAKKSGTRALVFSALGAFVFLWFVGSLLLPGSHVSYDGDGLQVWWPMDTTMGIAMNGVLLAIGLTALASLWLLRPQK